MRLALCTCLFIGVAGLAGTSCQSCPEGGSGDSLFCHAAAGDCAANETSCGGTCTSTDSDRDNCGTCGTVCGDGMTCTGGQCVDGCDNGETTCGGACTDTTSDPGNCGACGSACRADQVCATSVCGCATSDVTCGGTCTDPATSNTNCGATGDCLGSNAGVSCGSDSACVTGTCESTRIYRGSLTASTGRWTYNAVVGMTGANAACTAQFAGTQVCTSANLIAAAAKNELVNATDYMGNAVTDWWIDDATAPGPQRCQDATHENIPWSYQTAHLGNVGKYVTLTAATGAITEVETGSIPAGTGLCETARFVACCSIVTAP